MKRGKLTVATLLLLGAVSGLPVKAKTTNKGFSVTPAIIRLDMASDRPQADLTYTNNADSGIQISLSASDFTQLEDGYKLSFVEAKDPANYRYSLASWMSFDQSSLVLGPKETKRITVYVDTNRLSAGSHYGTIMAQISGSTDSPDIPINSVLASLLFVRTATGKEIESGTITAQSVVSDWFIFPDSLIFRFNNTGNTDLVPHGTVDIKDPFGKLAARGVVNEDSQITLPETIRKFTVPIRTYHRFLLPGIYTADLTVRYGKTDREIKLSKKFFSQGSLPLPFLAGLLTMCLVIYLLRNRHSRKTRRFTERKQSG